MMDERYRNELDRVRLTAESKAELARALVRWREAAPRREPVRRWSRTTLAAAAVACALAVSVGAAVVAAPVVGDHFGHSAGYEQSAASLGQSVTKNGWTMTLTDCVADDFDLYLGITLTAPEGTVLDDAHGYYFAEWGGAEIAVTKGGSARYEQLEDDGPADNELHFILWNEYLPQEGMTLNGQTMEVTFGGLYHHTVWNETEQEWERAYDCDETWTFRVPLSYPESTIRLEPDLPVRTLDVDATIAEVSVSPLSVYVRIEGDALKGHHSWVPKNAPDGWYGCVEYQEVTLYTKDGTAIPMMNHQAGSGCSGGDLDHPEDGWIRLVRRPDAPLDVDDLASISICGVEIPLT